MPSLTQLEYIVAVDHLRHFGKAAKACHVTQPSLSMQIQKAEEELGLILFDRDKKPILPTEKGLALIEQAKLILREHARLLHMSRSAAGELSGSLRLGIIPTLAPYLLPRFLADFSLKYPKVELEIDEMKTEDIVTALRQDGTDAGLLATPLRERGLHEKVIFYEPFFAYISRDHPLAAREEVSEEDLGGQGIWLLQDGHCFRKQILQYCGLSDHQKCALANVSFAGGNFETLRQLIRHGQGYTVFPQLFIDELPAAERQAAVRPLAAPVPTREISLVYRRDHWKGEIIDALHQAIVECLPEGLRDQDRRNMEVIPVGT